MANFDLEKTRVVAGLFAIPRDERDGRWLRDFFAAIAEASMTASVPQVTLGPDGFPYFRLSVPGAGEFETFCVAHIAPAAVANGFGVTIFASPEAAEPEWVFSYGDILSYRLYRSFAGDPDAVTEGPSASGREIVTEARDVLVASPSEAYLPKDAMRCIGAYLRERAHMPHPRLGILIDPSQEPAQNVFLALSAADFGGDEADMERCMQRARWFLPRTHGLVASGGINAAGLAELP